MASRLSDCLVRDGTLRADMVRAATARQAVYGGALDTAILELGALDEPTLWNALATATGVPIPDAALFENPDPSAAERFDVQWSRRCRAVPVGQVGGVLQLCCSEPVDRASLEAARASLGVSFEIFVVPEVRLAAARQAVYGEPMSPRLLRVLARLLGAQPVRRWVKALTPQVNRTATPEPAPTAAPAVATSAAPAAVAKAAVEEGELAEAEFDVPVNTYNTEPADIIESRASRAAAEAAAAAEVARALGGHEDPTAPGVREAAVVARALAGHDDPTAPGVREAAVVARALAGHDDPTAPGVREAAVVARALAGHDDPTAPGVKAPSPSPKAAPADDGAATLRGRVRAEGGAPSAAAAPPRASVRTPIGRPSLEAAQQTDENEDQLCTVADDAESEARLAALRVLRARLGRPRVRALADKLQGDLKGAPERAVLAASALGELRDPQAVPALIDALEGPASIARTAARALVEIAQQDFGQNRKKWLAWWAEHKKTDRVAWLLEGLSHRSAEIRFASSEELRLITGEYFGYHFDLPKREREEARERWQQWWYQSGHARLPDRG
jgi:hypothetical protein